ncbi:MAG: hypothetical protein HY652_01615 [Acidobacteria bacterium]|nr:hypothetical protein [Acidobacteriota bacterium]
MAHQILHLELLPRSAPAALILSKDQERIHLKCHEARNPRVRDWSDNLDYEAVLTAGG